MPANDTQARRTTKPDIDYPESEERRILELRLLYHWVTKTGFTILGSEDQSYRERLLTLPYKSMEFPALLYAMFAFTAIHIAKTSSSTAEIVEFNSHFQRYLGLSLHEHRRDVDELCQQNADVVCLASNIIRNCTQVTIQDRELDPYVPPCQWLYMMNGSGDVFKAAWGWVINDAASLAQRIGIDGPDLSDLDKIFAAKNRIGLEHLLQRSRKDEELESWDDEIQHAYELTLNFIGGIQIAIDRKEKLAHSLRRVIAFPMFISKRYTDLVGQMQPRALVILAFYFSYLARLRNVWWVGDTGRREIYAIRYVLKSPWVEMLQWPLKNMEEAWDINSGSITK